MTEIYLHFLFAQYGLYGNAPVAEKCSNYPTAPPLTVWFLLLVGQVLEVNLCQSDANDRPSDALRAIFSVTLTNTIRWVPRLLPVSLFLLLMVHSVTVSVVCLLLRVRGHIIGHARNNT